MTPAKTKEAVSRINDRQDFLASVAVRIQIPLHSWVPPGMDVCQALIDCRYIFGHAIKGWWIDNKTGIEFPHSWIEMPYELIADPCRWFIEGKVTKIYCGPKDRFYHTEEEYCQMKNIKSVHINNYTKCYKSLVYPYLSEKDKNFIRSVCFDDSVLTVDHLLIVAQHEDIQKYPRIVQVLIESGFSYLLKPQTLDWFLT